MPRGCACIKAIQKERMTQDCVIKNNIIIICVLNSAGL